MLRYITSAHKASRPAHVTLGLRGLVNEETVQSITRLPEVDQAEGGRPQTVIHRSAT